ncbi:MAG: hypothetical protein LW832_03890 [Parachlamydia sp.]|jgi:hypothetical protein|nr:hypothetical protein [Parachlamydia sp.]
MKRHFLLSYIFILIAIIFVINLKTMNDFKEEGRSITRTLITHLQKIQTRDRLLVSAKSLQGLFEQLGNVMVSAEAYNRRHPNQEIVFTQLDHELSDALRMELERVYRIEGGREVIETCQKTARQKLSNLN